MTGIARFGAAIVAVAWLALACASSPPVDPAASPRISCVDVPQANCDEAVASVARSLPNEHPALIEIICASPPCTAASGATMTIVTLADGRRLTSNALPWSDPTASGGGGGIPVPVPGGPGVAPLPVEPTCQGVPPVSCRDMAASFLDPGGGHGGVISIVVRCTKNPCTVKTGEGDTLITYGDGTNLTGGWAYSSGS